jgi:class 3 adenylate cyclase/predicted ATPase
MRCAKCGTESTTGAKFCDACGTALAQGCPACGATNRAGARFCNACGTALGKGAEGVTAPDSAQSAASAVSIPIVTVGASVEAESVLDGEHKLVTALFADIKGSTELMEEFDPADVRRLIDPALQLLVEAVRRYDGYVVRTTGDRIFALFGAPTAHEDHPQRALYAALRMQQELRRYSAKLRQEGLAPLDLRMGASTGEVVVHSTRTGDAHPAYMPIGQATNLASRMQTLAATGSIAVTESTQRACEGYFTFRALGPTRVKGVSEPVNVHEVTGIGALRTRLQRAAGRGLTRFVGRESEMTEMRCALELVKQGHGQIVAAMGTAGLGKSRLFHEFKATSQSGCLVLDTFSVSHGKASAYFPIIDLLHGYFEISAEDDARKRREKVAGKTVILDRALGDTLPYLYALLGIVDGDDPLAAMDAQLRKRRTLDAVKRLVLRESLNQPLIVTIEDLHWVDAETQAFLDLLADAIANARVLLLVNYRPEYQHNWGSRTHYAQLRLDPLGRESAELMLAGLLGGDAALEPLKRLIIERTEGNPFFMEETVQVLVDEGALVRNGAIKLTKPLDELRIPPTVQAILSSRIDRLPNDEKELLQKLAVIGKEFPLGLIEKVTGNPRDELERMLSDLQLGEFIYEQPALPDVEYSFKHALTLEVAYSSVLSDRRRVLHERIAAAVESFYADRLDDHLAELAHQYRRGGNLEKAIEYLCRAGQQAAAKGADHGALAQLGTALELISKLPDEHGNRVQETRLRILIGPSLMAVKGLGSPETSANYTRALELCQRAGDTSALFAALSGLWTFHLVRAEHREADALVQQLLALADKSGDDPHLAFANFAAGNTAFWRGHFEDAYQRLARSIAACDPGQRLYQVFVDDPVVYARAYAAWTQYHRGYPDQALAIVKDCMQLAARMQSPRTLAMATQFAGHLHLFRREPDAVVEHSRALRSLADEHGLPFYQALAEILAGCAAIQHGAEAKAVECLNRGIEAWRNLDSGLALPWFLGEFAAGLSSIGRYDEALEVVHDALSRSEESGERQFAPELHRIAGMALLTQGNLAEAESFLRRAIEIARTQGARMWELRAATGLARLLGDSGRCGEARAMLIEIHNWFSEGFDIADLKDAKALLDQLNE